MSFFRAVAPNRGETLTEGEATAPPPNNNQGPDRPPHGQAQ